MAKNTAALKTQEPLPEAVKHRQMIRHRFIGTAVVLTATFLLWKIGGEPPPENIQEVPPLEQVFSDATEETLFAAETAADITTASVFAPELEAALSTRLTAASPDVADITVSVSAVVTATTAAITPAPPPAPPELSPESPPPEKPAAAAAKYIIQIGAYGDKARAEANADKIRRHKFSVQLQPLTRDNKTLWRVRVINFSSRAAAERGQKELAQLGYAKSRLLPAPATSSAAESAAASSAVDNSAAAAAGQYLLRIGSFRARANADKAAVATRAITETVQVEEVTVNGVVFFRVTATDLVSRVTAEKVQKQLVQAGYRDSTILKENE